MIHELRIRGFRGVRDGQISGLGRINLLVGPNGAGKSTAMESLLLVAAAVAPMDPLEQTSRMNLIGRRHNETEVAESWWYRFQTNEKIVVQVEHLGAGGGEVQLAYGAGAPVKVGLPTSRETFWRNTVLLDVDSARSNRVEALIWPRLFAVRGDRIVVDCIKRLYGLDADVLTYGANGRLSLGLKDTGLPVDSLGTGVRVAIRCLMAAIVFKGSLLLLEEVDAFQSSQSLNLLAAAISDILHKSESQVFITTHRLQTLSAFLSAENAETEVKVVPLGPLKDGILRAQAMAHSDAMALIRSGVDLRELFGKDIEPSPHAS